MKDKYNLTSSENIFLAKKVLISSIYHGARLENCNVTFPDTQTILDGVSVGNLKMHDVEVILNLRDAWKYLLDNMSSPLDLDYICKINYFVARNESLDWGVLRDGRVGISGTSYIPPVPRRDDAANEITKILNSDKTVTAQAIELFLWCCRSQLFWDGNKRTSLISANKILVAGGRGVLIIEDKYLREFNRRLTSFYDTNDYSVIDTFIYDKCIKGLTR